MAWLNKVTEETFTVAADANPGPTGLSNEQELFMKQKKK